MQAGRTRLIAPHAFLAADDHNGELPEPLKAFYADHQPVLISAGQLEPEYDLPLQIDVMERVRERFPQAGLLLLGQGSLVHRLRKKIEEKPFAKHILLAGDIAHEVTGPDLENPRWNWWGAVARRAADNPAHWSRARPTPGLFEANW